MIAKIIINSNVLSNNVALIISFLAILLGYLLGSIPPAYILGKLLHGVDIRQQGSGNVGGANAGRLFGKKVFIMVALFDIFKGTIAVFIATLIVPGNTASSGLFSSPELFYALTGFMAILGHCYSMLLGFSGGKGAATTAGVVLAFDPIIFVILLSSWLITVGTTRFTSLGNLVAVSLLPFTFNFLQDYEEYTLLGWLILVLIFWKHRENIVRLINGEERKFGNKEKIQSNVDNQK